MKLNNKKRLFTAGSAIALLCIALFSLLFGATQKSIEEVTLAIFSSNPEHQSAIIFDLRLPRFLFACLAGIGLAVSGAGLQGLFRNPLTEPSIIGVSSGAACFAAFVIVLAPLLPVWLIEDLGDYTLSFFAFLGSAVTTIGVYYLSDYKNHPSISTLLLTGIAVTAFFFGIVGFLTYLADDQQLRSLTFWNLGSLAGATWQLVAITTIPIVICVIGIYKRSMALDALSLGENNASHLGIDVKKLSWEIIIFSALGVGVITAFCGIISFVGIIVPHVARLLFGPSHKFLILASTLLGAVFLSAIDLLSRTLFLPSELPINILTSIAGAPLFVFLLIKSKQGKLSYV